MENRCNRGRRAGICCNVVISLLFLLGCLLPLKLVFAQNPSLFEATVPVAGQGESERQVAIQLALIDVLIKNSGRIHIASEPEIDSILQGAQKRVSHFVYRSRTQTTESAVPFDLVVNFDPDSVKELIADSNIPFWSALRPPVVAWIVVDEGHERLLVDRSEKRGKELRRVLEKQAQLRGIPLIFPINDEAEQDSLSLSDIWGGFRQPIQAASSRYQTSQMLVGRAVKEMGERWLVRWVFWSDYDMISWEDRQTELRFSLEAAVDKVVTSMSRHYAIQPGKQIANRYGLVFSGISNAYAYNRLQEFLARQSNLSRQMLVAQTERDSLIEVVIEGQPDLFFNALRHTDWASERPFNRELISEQLLSTWDREGELKLFEVLR